MSDADYSSDPYDPAPYPVPNMEAELASVARICAYREEYKADLTAYIDRLAEICDFIDRLDGDLNSSDDDWADSFPDWKDWLRGADLDVFRKQLEKIREGAQVLAAINRPHPGTPLWPQQLTRGAYPRDQYAIHATTTDGRQLTIGDNEPLHTSLREADILIHRVLADPTIATAEVMVRRWTPGAWQTPDRSEHR